MTHKNALPEPYQIADAPQDDTVVEVARVWINGGKPAIFVRPAYDDPRAMGVLMAELCWQFSDSYQQHHGLDQRQALELLKQGWEEGHRRAEAFEAQRNGQ